MKVSPAWREWVADLPAQRLRDLHDSIATHLAVAGALTAVDELMLKLTKAELASRYEA